MANIFAFDPGLKGGAASIKGGVVVAIPMPTAAKELDLPTIAGLLSASFVDFVVIEKVHSMPAQGVASSFKFGVGYGQLMGLCAALSIPYTLVTPQAWKKQVLAGTPKDKRAAIEFCRREYPLVPLIQPGCRLPHDGVADALCLLSYGQSTYRGEGTSNGP